MRHLFDAVTLRPISHMQDTVDRVVVSQGDTQFYLDNRNDRLREVLGLDNLPGTLHHSQDVLEFINHDLVRLLRELIELNVRVDICCDDNSLLILITIWLKHLFRELTEDNYLCLMSIIVSNRSAIYRDMDDQSIFFNVDILRDVFSTCGEIAGLREFIQEYREHISLEFLMYGVMCGDDPGMIGGRLINSYIDGMDSALRQIHQEFALTYLTTSTQNHLGFVVNTPKSQVVMEREIPDLDLIGGGFTMDHLLSIYTGRLEELSRELSVQINKIMQGTNGYRPTLLTPGNNFSLIKYIENPSEFTKVYINQLLTTIYPFDLFPDNDIEQISPNLISWLSRQMNTPTSCRLTWQEI